MYLNLTNKKNQREGGGPVSVSLFEGEIFNV